MNVLITAILYISTYRARDLLILPDLKDMLTLSVYFKGIDLYSIFLDVPTYILHIIRRAHIHDVFFPSHNNTQLY